MASGPPFGRPTGDQSLPLTRAVRCSWKASRGSLRLAHPDRRLAFLELLRSPDEPTSQEGLPCMPRKCRKLHRNEHQPTRIYGSR
jgi:hypothetical protein